jgi:hypothetical protein
MTSSPLPLRTALFTITIFASALLLFVIQPLFARFILPLLGGSPSVWNTAMVFYQVVLLIGYLYAHLLRTYLSPRQQVGVHIAVLLLPLLVLPIAVPPGWTPPTSENPIMWMLALLTIAVGLPFFVVSTSSPLIQSWFSRFDDQASHNPYFLYAASNAGSMIALLSYPFVIEPRMRLADQSSVWSVGYGVLIVLMALCGVAVWRSGSHLNTQAQTSAALDKAPPQILTYRRRLRWVLLAAIPSSLMLSVTSYLSSNITPFPLLWVVPLALYLLTFILVFMTKPLIPHAHAVRALPVLLTLLVITLAVNAAEPILLLFPLHLVTFFVATLVCHGELAADRPPAAQLTEFYLLMSVGGAIGGMFTALLAPQIFSTILEYPIVLVLLCALVRPSTTGAPAFGRRDLLVVLGVVLFCVVLLMASQALGLNDGFLFYAIVFGLPGLLVLASSGRPLRFALGVAALLLFGQLTDSSARSVLYTERSFFGINRVLTAGDGSRHVLLHGITVHGLQDFAPGQERMPLSYYHPTGPFGQAMAGFNRTGNDQKVAVIGLGVGGSSCYAQPDQQWTFYEIDPAVVRIARDLDYFTYLRTCVPTAEIVLGDGRLTLAQAPDASYNLIVLDAYSSDAIPTHLVTREALAIYRAKLAPGGVLVFNISNRYLDLKPVLAQLFADSGMVGASQLDVELSAEEDKEGKSPSEWVIAARSPTDYQQLIDPARWTPLVAQSGDPVWTDDFHSILSIFRLREQLAAASDVR